MTTLKMFAKALKKLSEAIENVAQEQMAYRLDVGGTGTTIDYVDGRYSVDGASDWMAPNELDGADSFDCVCVLQSAYGCAYGESAEIAGYRAIYQVAETDGDCPWCSDDTEYDTDDCMLCDGSGYVTRGGYAVYAPLYCRGCGEYQHSCECASYMYQMSDAGCYGDGAFGHAHIRVRLAECIDYLADLIADRVRDMTPYDQLFAAINVKAIARNRGYLQCDDWSDGLSEEDDALELLNSHSVPGLAWEFYQGDLVCRERPFDEKNGDEYSGDEDPRQ